MTAVARTSTDPERTALALQTAGREVEPDLRVFETKTMDRHLALMRLPQLLFAFVLSAFGVLALAAIGLYGVVSYTVSWRRREIGIRMALGADGTRVVRLLVAGGLRLVVAGGALGLALALAAARRLGGLLFEVDTLDPLTFIGVPLVLAAAILAAWCGPPRQPPPSGHCPPERLTAAVEHHGLGLQRPQTGLVPATEPDLRFGIERKSGDSDSLSLHQGVHLGPL